MKNHLIALSSMLCITYGAAGQEVLAHCEIPCGIYDDQGRFTAMEENITTIEKSMHQIVALSKETEPNYNQIVRWVNNKEAHADGIRDIATQYFLAQRIQPVVENDTEVIEKYHQKLNHLHLIIVHAMKAKQTTDLEHVKKLRALVASFKKFHLRG